MTPIALLVGAVTLLTRMFGLTAGYHRYFCHRTFKTTRVFQFALAWLGAASAQRGPLWWGLAITGYTIGTLIPERTSIHRESKALSGLMLVGL